MQSVWPSNSFPDPSYSFQMSEVTRLNCHMIEFRCLKCQSAGRCGQQLGEGKVVLVSLVSVYFV